MGSRHRSLLTCDTRVFWLQLMVAIEKKSTQEYQMVEILEDVMSLGDKMMLTLMMCYLQCYFALNKHQSILPPQMQMTHLLNHSHLPLLMHRHYLHLLPHMHPCLLTYYHLDCNDDIFCSLSLYLIPHLLTCH